MVVMGGVRRKMLPSRPGAASLAVVLALGCWLPGFPMPEASASPSPAHSSKSPGSCACARCPGERECCCEHGQAPQGSTCSTPTQEPAGSASAPHLPTTAGKMIVHAPTLIDLPTSSAADRDSLIIQRSYPYPSPPDKVPIPAT